MCQPATAGWGHFPSKEDVRKRWGKGKTRQWHPYLPLLHATWNTSPTSWPHYSISLGAHITTCGHHQNSHTIAVSNRSYWHNLISAINIIPQPYIFLSVSSHVPLAEQYHVNYCGELQSKQVIPPFRPARPESAQLCPCLSPCQTLPLWQIFMCLVPVLLLQQWYWTSEGGRDAITCCHTLTVGARADRYLIHYTPAQRQWLRQRNSGTKE